MFNIADLNSPPAVTEGTAGRSPWCAVTVVPALAPRPVLHGPLGLGRPGVSELRGPGAVTPLTAVRVVLV